MLNHNDYSSRGGDRRRNLDPLEHNNEPAKLGQSNDLISWEEPRNMITDKSHTTLPAAVQVAYPVGRGDRTHLVYYADNGVAN